MTAVAELAPVINFAVVPEDAKLLPLAAIGMECERNPKGNPAFDVWDAQAQEYGTGAGELCVARRILLNSKGMLDCGECACARLIEIAQADPGQRAELAGQINVVKSFTKKEIK